MSETDQTSQSIAADAKQENLKGKKLFTKKGNLIQPEIETRLMDDFIA